jgi:hypothetical protein
VLAFFMIQGLPTGDIWLAFKHSLAASKANKRCQDIVEQLQTFERSYAYDRHGASAYTNSEISTALFAKKGTGGGSKKKDCKASGGDRDSSQTIKCFGCGKKGHKKFECRSKHLWKENSEKEKKESSKANVVKDEPAPSVADASMDFLLLFEEGREPLALRPEGDEIRESVSTDRCTTTTDWVVDSGATSHCTGMDHEWLRYRALAPGEHEVIFADESKVSAAGIGDIGLLLPCGNGTSTRIILRNVLHVPACGRNNLMSVYQFLTVGVKVDYDLDPKRGVTLFTKKDRKTKVVLIIPVLLSVASWVASLILPSLESALSFFCSGVKPPSRQTRWRQGRDIKQNTKGKVSCRRHIRRLRWAERSLRRRSNGRVFLLSCRVNILRARKALWRECRVRSVKWMGL